MASLNMFAAPAALSTTTTTTSSSISTTNSVVFTRARRVQTFATAAKGSGKSSQEEEGLFDWLAGIMAKNDMLETDPLLQKVEGKSGTTTVSSKKTTAAAPPKKDSGSGGFGGLGGLFSKK
ncbi:hypothetical protein LXL04_017874 [Taraxacum kok-saghyz]